MRTRDRDVAAEAIDQVAAHRMPFLLAGFIADGGARLDGRGEAGALPRVQGMFFPVGVPASGEYGDSTFVLLRLPIDLAADLAESITGLPSTELRFDGLTPISEEMRRLWVRTTDFVWRQLSIPGAEPPPLMTDRLVRLIASTLISAFAGTTTTPVPANEGGHVAPAVLRRATAFIEEHPAEPLTVSQIAAAAGLGIRGLQSAFRRHLDMTPMAYLRRVRLGRARRDLLDGDPLEGATVQEIARRWGFVNLGRFAAEYRAEYGHSPSETLRG